MEIPVYKTAYKGVDLALFTSDVGAPACTAVLEDVFQFFYAADNLDAETWDMRSLSNLAKLSEKDKVALLAMDFAATL